MQMIKKYNDIYCFNDDFIEFYFTTKKYKIVKNSETYIPAIKSLIPNYKHIIITKQIHSSVSNRIRGRGFYIGDAIFTDEKNIIPAIFTADCFPVFLYSKNVPFIALLHAGWRGISKNILSETIRSIKKNYNDIKEINAIIGPGICKDCYQVGIDILNKFDKKYLNMRDNKLYLDLKSVLIHQMEDNSISKITDSGFCTVHNNDSFFSYRKENRTENRILSFGIIR